MENRIFQPLGEQGVEFLTLLRSAMIGVDNLVDDERYPSEYFLRIIKIVHSSWDKENPRPQNTYEAQLISAIRILKWFFDDGFYQAEQVFREILKEYGCEYQWALSRGRVLTSKIIKEINTDMGRMVAALFIYFQLPKMTVKDFRVTKGIIEPVVQKFGLAIKEADNLASIYTDIYEGFVTIPRENLNEISGLTIKNNKVVAIDKAQLKVNKEYILKWSKEVELIYNKANDLLHKTGRMTGLTDRQMELFSKWAYTWFEDRIRP